MALDRVLNLLEISSIFFLKLKLKLVENECHETQKSN